MEELYQKKGEIITKLEMLQEQLKHVNQAIMIEMQKQQALKKEETK